MDDLRLIDLLIAIIFAGCGWYMNNIWAAVKDLQSADGKIADKVASLEVFVATNYLSVERFEVVMTKNAQMVEKLGDKIDRLSDKIDTKMDKP